MHLVFVWFLFFFLIKTFLLNALQRSPDSGKVLICPSVAAVRIRRTNNDSIHYESKPSEFKEEEGKIEYRFLPF